MNEGSKNASLALGLPNPTGNQKKVDVPAEARVVSNFDDGSKNMSSKLLNGGGGQWLAITFGGNKINSDFVVAGGANNTPKAAHLFGTLIDKGDKTYPAFQLQGRFKDNGYYDASSFTGIKFYYKCPATDAALKRRFAIGSAPTLPISGGGACTDNCYNNFGADMKLTPEWTANSYAFADLKRESGWGGPVTPPDLTDHLKEFIDLEWANSANDAAGSYNIDYWVDEVELF